jgi:hypothetical protein
VGYFFVRKKGSIDLAGAAGLVKGRRAVNGKQAVFPALNTSTCVETSRDASGQANLGSEQKTWLYNLKDIKVARSSRDETGASWHGSRRRTGRQDVASSACRLFRDARAQNN